MSNAQALITILLLAVTALYPSQARAGAFDPVYQILKRHCGDCHRVGGASAWVHDLPAERYPHCLDEPVTQQQTCTTHAQLVEVPGEDIPAWVRPHDATGSEPWAQACDPAVSFHIGHSLQRALPDTDCAVFLHWIESGAHR